MAMTAPTDIAGSTDKRTLQFWQLATDVGQQLTKIPYKWQILTAEFTITTVIGQDKYDLPADFDGFVQDSAWNYTTSLPVLGSLQQFEWQMLKARLLAGTTFTALFRVADDKVQFYQPPTSVQTIVLPYTSRGWVRDGSDPLVRKDNLETNTDFVLFDPQLFKVALKLAWYENKQFDTAKVRAQYEALLSAAKATDSPSRTLSIGRAADYPYLGIMNIPDTGYGNG
jgi:hypothetical protein